MSKHLSKAEKGYLRKRLLKQGQVVARRLADLLAGKDVNDGVYMMPGDDAEEMKKEDRLRRYLDLINARRKALEDPEGGYGVCERCGGAISYAELDQMAWAVVCRGCGGA